MSSSIYELTTEPQVSSLVALLTPNLPFGLSIARRLQHQPRTLHTLILATFDPTTVESHSPSTPYCIGIFDRTALDLHQVNLHSSVERHTNPPSNTEFIQVCALLAYFHRARPGKGVKTMWDVFMPLDPDVPVPENEDVVFAGATHARVAEMLTGHPLLRKHGVRIARDDIAKRGGPYVALVFRTPRMAEERGEVPPGYRGGEELPEGLVWDVVRTDVDVEGVMANNALVRVREQLQGRQNVAVRCTETGELVGWAYHGMDGSVKTLFVRPEWRRKGLARKVVRRLVADADWGDGWCRADVAPDNVESNALFSAFGAKPFQESFWFKIDIAPASVISPA